MINNLSEPVTLLDANDIPASVDWRTKGAVTPVQNQKVCGSCWAFSAIAAMEGEHFLKTGKLVKLSEQQCIDCADGNGCNGGEQRDCFSYAKGEMMDTEDQYPYTGWSDECWPKSDGVLKVSSYTNVQQYSESQLKAAISKQPVSVTVDSNDYPFMHYMSGIVTEACKSGLDHAVTAVGYGTENGTGYYIVKNSWGADWGEHGYIRIGMNGDGAGICGIQMQSLYPETD